MISPRTHVTTISFFFIVSFLIYFLVTDWLSLSPGFPKCASIFITIPLMSYSKLLVLFSCNLFLIYFCHFLISHFYVAHSSFSHECSFQLPRTWFIVQFIIGISFIFIIIIFFFVLLSVWTLKYVDFPLLQRLRDYAARIANFFFLLMHQPYILYNFELAEWEWLT